MGWGNEFILTIYDEDDLSGKRVFFLNDIADKILGWKNEYILIIYDFDVEEIVDNLYFFIFIKWELKFDRFERFFLLLNTIKEIFILINIELIFIIY